MKALILTEGGKRTGFGHLTRCLALAQGLKNSREVRQPQIRFIVQGDASARDFLKKQGLSPIFLDWIRCWEEISESIEAADFIFIDSYKAPADLYSSISRLNPGAIVTAIDDYKRIDYDADIVINPSGYGDQINYKKNVYGIGRPRYLLGREYIITRREFWLGERKGIHREIKNVLVTLGGMDYGGLLTRIIRFLSARYPLFQLYVVAGRGQAKRKTRNQPVWRKNLKFYSQLSAAAMRKKMTQADLCISGCGQTLNELARCGTPTLGICLADNQQLNAQYFHKRGFIEYLGRARQRHIFLNLGRAIEKMISPLFRKTKSRLGQKLVDGRGVKRIIAACREARKEKMIFLRPARKADCRDIWLWRNHPRVRQQAFFSRPIAYADHRKWFRRMKDDARVRLYIAENFRKEKIGQARFDRDGRRSSLISANLNPEFFGRRLGSRLVQEATRDFLKKYPAVKHVLADIKLNNVISQKAFVKAGYQYFQDSRKNGQLIITYIFRRHHGRH